MSSSSLTHDEDAHSASSSTRVSVQAVSPTLSAGALGPTPSARLPPSSIKHFNARHTTDSSSEAYVPIVRPQTPSVTESERERIERERAVGAVSPPGENPESSEDEKETRQETNDPFLVVWDEDDKANPSVRPTCVRVFVCVLSDPQAS